MRILMTGGGTGGHINPALAIADIVKRNDKNAEIAFVGTEKGLENKLVPKAGYKLYYVNIQGIKRSLSLENIKTAFLVFSSQREARKIIDEFKPDIVVGTGGYVSWPLLKVASKMKIPTIVHESNAIAGVAVKQLKNKVDVIMTNFESSASNLNAKARTVRVGNPMNCDFGRYTKEEARKILDIPENIKTVILSCGGSGGADELNKAALCLMKDFVAKDESVMYFHASGRKRFENMNSEFLNLGLDQCKNIVLSDYIYNMPVLMSAADIVICRAGAMTLSEIALMKKAAVIVPSPNVTDNHQYKNAKVLADADAALLIEEKNISGLTECVKKLSHDKAAQKNMEEKISKFAVADAGEKIYSEICSLVKESKNK